MMLCIDSGNTRLKWGLLGSGGLRAGARWEAQGVVAQAQTSRLQLPQAPERIVACNVAGAAGHAAITALAERCGVTVEWVRSQAAQCGVVSRYENPAQLGADRWAALIGAHALHGGSCVVVMCGTATTIDVLDGAGVFQGGLILPGLDLMRAALAAGTADLPTARGEYRDLPRNTFDAMASGAIHATLGAVERLAAPLGVNAACIISGGAAALLTPHLALPHRVVDNLVLEGVARIAAAL